MRTKRALHHSQLRHRAAELAIAGKHEESARLYQLILDHSAGNGDIALHLAEERRRSGDLPGAISAFERAACLFATEGRLAQADAIRHAIIGLRSLRPATTSWWRRALQSLTHLDS